MTSASDRSEETKNWFFRARQEWIAEMVRIYGFINREHLCRKFGISTPQASHDLKYFQQHHPRAMKYNTQLKRYEEVAR